MAKFKIGDRVAHATNEGPDMIVVSEFMADAGLGNADAQAYDCEFWSNVKGEFLIHRFWETSLQASQRG